LADIAITIDKVSHVLHQLGTSEAPLRKMTSQEVFTALWASKDSIKNQLVQVLRNLEASNSDSVEACFSFIEMLESKSALEVVCHQDNQAKFGGNKGLDEEFYSQRCAVARDVFLFVSQELRHFKT
jgi:hypothetical protein